MSILLPCGIYQQHGGCVHTGSKCAYTVAAWGARASLSVFVTIQADILLVFECWLVGMVEVSWHCTLKPAGLIGIVREYHFPDSDVSD